MIWSWTHGKNARFCHVVEEKRDVDTTQLTPNDIYAMSLEGSEQGLCVFLYDHVEGEAPRSLVIVFRLFLVGGKATQTSPHTDSLMS
jgi:hypothetical protein